MLAWASRMYTLRFRMNFAVASTVRTLAIYVRVTSHWRQGRSDEDVAKPPMSWAASLSANTAMQEAKHGRSIDGTANPKTWRERDMRAGADRE